MTRPPNPKLPLRPATEENDPQIKTTIFLQELMRLRPGSDLLDWEMLRGMELILEERGDVFEGGPDNHQFFVEMSTQEMRAVVEATISECRLAVKRAFILDELPESHGERFLRLMSALLYLVARGNIAFRENERLVFGSPTGSPPNYEMREKILGRIRHDHPMHIAIAQDLIEEMKSEHSADSEPVQ